MGIFMSEGWEPHSDIRISIITNIKAYNYQVGCQEDTTFEINVLFTRPCCVNQQNNHQYLSWYILEQRETT